MLDEAQGGVLLKLARGAIGERFDRKPAAPPEADWLREAGATFVTLTEDGELRGCIGSLEAHRPLIDDVRENARAAAFQDPRFLPLSRVEFDLICVEVSLLSPALPMTFRDEADALAQLKPHVDGVILETPGHRATFLPQVWDQLPDPAAFIAHLKHKAGLPIAFWSPEIKLARYAVQKWKEP